MKPPGLRQGVRTVLWFLVRRREGTGRVQDTFAHFPTQKLP